MKTADYENASYNPSTRSRKGDPPRCWLAAGHLSGSREKAEEIQASRATLKIEPVRPGLGGTSR